jgi:hypothetical protein
VLTTGLVITVGLPDVIPVWSMISRPTTVLVSWNAGRQCMNLTAGLAALSIRAEFSPADWWCRRARAGAGRRPGLQVDGSGGGRGVDPLGRIVDHVGSSARKMICRKTTS